MLIKSLEWRVSLKRNEKKMKLKINKLVFMKKISILIGACYK